MPLSTHQASVPVFLRMLKSLAAMLEKTAEHAAEQKIDPNAYLGARLYPDMFPLVRQVQIAADFAKNTTARLAGVEIPKFADTEASFEELQERIAKTIAFLEGINSGQIDSSGGKDISFKAGSRDLHFKHEAYLTDFGLPNFYFHMTTAYNILRHNGIKLGKMDFIGPM